MMTYILISIGVFYRNCQYKYRYGYGIYNALNDVALTEPMIGDHNEEKYQIIYSGTVEHADKLDLDALVQKIGTRKVEIDTHRGPIKGTFVKIGNYVEGLDNPSDSSISSKQSSDSSNTSISSKQRSDSGSGVYLVNGDRHRRYLIGIHRSRHQDYTYAVPLATIIEEFFK
jgi:hypothetical protein